MRACAHARPMRECAHGSACLLENVRITALCANIIFRTIEYPIAFNSCTNSNAVNLDPTQRTLMTMFKPIVVDDVATATQASATATSSTVARDIASI